MAGPVLPRGDQCGDGGHEGPRHEHAGGARARSERAQHPAGHASCGAGHPRGVRCTRPTIPSVGRRTRSLPSSGRWSASSTVGASAAAAGSGSPESASPATRAVAQGSETTIVTRRIERCFRMAEARSHAPASGDIRSGRTRQVRHRGAGDAAAGVRRMHNCLRCSHHTAEEGAVKYVSGPRPTYEACRQRRGASRWRERARLR